ncbi:MAG: hypothetical protein BZY81_00645 [SAR202 cluster bacterium Io17-Chloro-G4]|nr:MAG: hypothetical protein BZY81_00645 [SAR202 cluster bacterium Io17-Chloro-G4]
MTQPRPKLEDPLGAFCTDTEAYLPGSTGGPLSGLSFAAKDIFDVAGHVTGGGNPDWKATHGPADKTAWVIQKLVDAGAAMVGKTHTDELTRGILGENAHYGTPTNPKVPGRVPGGSSSGSASAVAGGLVDFALGSDTGGSVRIPASFCGLIGLRPTHGRIPLDGILLQAPSYDTIGWFARDPEVFAKVGAVLFQNQIPEGLPTRLIVAEDAFEMASPEVAAALQPAVEAAKEMIGADRTERLSPVGLVEWSAQQQVLQGREAWDTAREWISQVNPRFSFWVAERYMTASSTNDAKVAKSKVERQEVIDRMDELTAGGGVVCLPTSPAPAPPLGQSLAERRDVLSRIVSLTCVAGTTGRPQISVPVAEVDGMPVGLSFLGERGSDELLISLAGKLFANLSD